MIVTKFDGNPMKYVEEETNCQKERKKKEETRHAPFAKGTG